MSIKKNVGISLLLASFPKASFAAEKPGQQISPRPRKSEVAVTKPIVDLAQVFDLLIKRIDLRKVESDAELIGSSSTLQ